MKEDNGMQWLEITFQLKATVDKIKLGYDDFNDAEVIVKGKDWFHVGPGNNIKKLVKDTMIARNINVIDIRITDIK